MSLRPLAGFPRAAAAAVHTVFADIDDTLSTDGRLTAHAYGALEALRDAGLRVVPVTGRPAGWCDHIARMWPVDGVIGENGAFWLWHDARAGRLRARHLLDEAARAAAAHRLDAVRERILHEVPGCAVASDQFCRLYDLAIDFREDVAPLPRAAIDRIVALMQAAGMTAKVSSIHVNGWFGHWDKLATARLMMRERYDLDLDAERARCVFVGDSPNDAPMFAFFPNAVGVANVLDFRDRLDALPAWITPSRCGAGFAELAQLLIDARGAALGPVHTTIVPA
ncbi:MAG: HAD-IIB family hydrolase [Burkholderiales bacterium]|nr:MAG: HAD-IIB family hydrolase [Burkholderiales bacterium]